MGSWKKRLADIRARNPDALPSWLRGSPPRAAWYRAEWQTSGGVPPTDAIRPIVVVLGWLDNHRLLTPAGAAALSAARSGALSDAALTPDLVRSQGTTFLNRCWEEWWAKQGLNLVMDGGNEASAVAGLDDLWQQLDPGEDGPAAEQGSADRPR